MVIVAGARYWITRADEAEIAFMVAAAPFLPESGIHRNWGNRARLARASCDTFV